MALVREMQEVGLKVIKYHYNIKSSRECTVKFTDDMRTCIWEYEDQKYSSKLLHRYFKCKDISSILYGPQSYTFRSYKYQDLLD